jgi:hypothetical protein
MTKKAGDDEQADAFLERRAFDESFRKLVAKGVPAIYLVESVLRARFLRASKAVAAHLPEDAREGLLAVEQAERAAADPILFHRMLTECEDRLRAAQDRNKDLVGLPAHTLRRKARGGRLLSERDALRLDGSPMGKALLRYARGQGLMIRSLADANPAVLPKIAREAGGREVARSAEQFLVELVHRSTGRWYFEDVANLLGLDDAKQLKDRSEDYRKRRRRPILPD